MLWITQKDAEVEFYLAISLSRHICAFQIDLGGVANKVTNLTLFKRRTKTNWSCEAITQSWVKLQNFVHGLFQPCNIYGLTSDVNLLVLFGQDEYFPITEVLFA